MRSPRPVPISQQIAAMQCDFPSFAFRREGNRPTWRGVIQPTDRGVSYQVKIVYQYPNSPRVWVVSPALHPGNPHHYPDGSLCLYYPQDGSWRSDKLISKTIVPWTALWLALYEEWCVTGLWYGPEVPHSGEKIR